MNDTSGPTLPTPLAYLGPDGSSWRMSQGTLLSEDQPLLERLPKWGIAQDSVLYQLAQPERLINVSGFSLLPTPVVNDMGDNKTLDWWQNWIEEKKTQRINGNGHGKSLSIEVRLLPTPRAQNGEARNMNIWKRPLDQPQNLENALARLTGENTEQPLTDGNTSSDDQHRLL